MTLLHHFDVLTYLYWLALLLVTLGSLAAAVIAFRFEKRTWAIISAGALAAAVFIAVIPAPGDLNGVHMVLGLVAIALAVVGGGPMAVLSLKLATRNTVPAGTHGGIMVENNGEFARSDALASAGNAVHEVLRGGLAIGVLERLAVIGTILAGFPEGIAVIVAIKGVGRFTELAAAEARERFIIGTLASLIWACACAALVHFAVI
ncbi:hypothetical protein [Glaciibacter superstes]|uniref:hypothetical protein n=1 Tax=Glaciibacter superstes TaxID=501023 RepID=UPI0003B45079|nr:hypothetical protein [Glaciibacter superstes]